MLRLVLASASPRRLQLLQSHGVPFTTVPSEIDESRRSFEEPPVYCARLAREKAGAVAQREQGALVLGADTIVVLDDDVLGKPANAEQAQWMLRRLAGRQHIVMTAVALIDPNGRLHAEAVERAEVVFRPLEEEEIESYVASGEPMDKAGAYAIQGGAASFVSQCRGERDTVIGLPVVRVLSMLRDAGFPFGGDGGCG